MGSDRSGREIFVACLYIKAGSWAGLVWERREDRGRVAEPTPRWEGTMGDSRTATSGDLT